MKCDICRERNAIIFVQQVSRNSSVELHLCETCALERGYPVNENRIDISLGGLFSGILKNQEGAPRQPACPACGNTLENLRKSRRAGCADCYRLFSAEIRSVLRSEGIQGVFTGSLPERLEAFTPRTPDPENLKKELDRAIEHEDYELAAYYRDRLRALGGSTT